MKLVALSMSVAVAVAAGGCGKSKDKDGGGGGGAGASCADAAANFVATRAADKYGKLGKLSPTPDQLKALTALVQTHCETGTFQQQTDKPWTGATRSCVAKAKPQAKMSDPDEATGCFRTQEKGYSLNVLQIVHVFVEGEEAKAAAAPPPPPADPAAGSGSGSAPAADPAAGSGSGSGSAPPPPAP